MLAKGIPIGRPPTVTLRNAHLSYVLTWYAFASGIILFLTLHQVPTFWTNNLHVRSARYRKEAIPWQTAAPILNLPLSSLYRITPPSTVSHTSADTDHECHCPSSHVKFE